MLLVQVTSSLPVLLGSGPSNRSILDAPPKLTFPLEASFRGNARNLASKITQRDSTDRPGRSPYSMVNCSLHIMRERL